MLEVFFLGGGGVQVVCRFNWCSGRLGGGDGGLSWGVGSF